MGDNIANPYSKAVQSPSWTASVTLGRAQAVFTEDISEPREQRRVSGDAESEGELPIYAPSKQIKMLPNIILTNNNKKKKNLFYFEFTVPG